MNRTLQMSLKERDRSALMRQVSAGQMTLAAAAKLLRVSYRQVRRHYKAYRERGDAGLVHGLRGRASNNRGHADARRDRALALYREHYVGWGPTLASEQMAERDGLVVDHETLRGWLIGSGLWKARREPARRHPRRARRPCLGELVQLDGSHHDWFGTGEPCCLMVMIDDATSLTHARFFEAETTEAVMTIFRSWVLLHGLPRSLYPDRHSIHRRNDKEADEIEHRTGKRPPTRFGEALAELGVELIWAGSPQAKGRVERANATHQDRLVKLMKLDGITTIKAANAYLASAYLPAHNARFMAEAAEVVDAHRPAPSEDELDAALCLVRERRSVDKTGCVVWRGRWFELQGKDATPRRHREVQVRQRLDERVELLDVSGRVLQSRELATPPAKVTPPRPSLSERVATHAGPSKPAATHPWRAAPAVTGSASARCARLRSTGHRDPPQRTVLLG